jgi:hypothetical protein
MLPYTYCWRNGHTYISRSLVSILRIPILCIKLISGSPLGTILQDKWDVPCFYFFLKNLQCSFTADAENVYHLLDKKYALSSACLECFWVSVQYCVLVQPDIVGCSNQIDVLFVYTQCLHLHRFCTTSMSSSQATVVTLILVSERRMGEWPGWTNFWFHFCAVVRGSWWSTF